MSVKIHHSILYPKYSGKLCRIVFFTSPCLLFNAIFVCFYLVDGREVLAVDGGAGDGRLVRLPHVVDADAAVTVARAHQVPKLWGLQR